MVPKCSKIGIFKIKISNMPHAYGHPLFQGISRRASPRVSAWAPYSAENSPGVTSCPTMSKKFETTENAVETTKRERALCYLKWPKPAELPNLGSKTNRKMPNVWDLKWRNSQNSNQLPTHTWRRGVLMKRRESSCSSDNGASNWTRSTAVKPRSKP